jgi:hypothetical protein
MLHAVAELGQHRLRHVQRVLGDEIDADALGADQAHHLLDALDQRARRVVEQQMRLVEEEDELRLVRIADFRQFLEQLRQQPEQEGRVEARDSSSACRRPARLIAPRPSRVVRMMSAIFSAGSPKKLLAPCCSSTSSSRWIAPTEALDIAVRWKSRRHSRPCIASSACRSLRSSSSRPLLVGDLEGDVDDAFLRVVEVHQPRQQQRPHLR